MIQANSPTSTKIYRNAKQYVCFDDSSGCIVYFMCDCSQVDIEYTYVKRIYYCDSYFCLNWCYHNNANNDNSVRNLLTTFYYYL